MNRTSSVRDLTGKQPAPGGGMNFDRTFLLCPRDHKGSSTGAQFKSGVGYIRCAACNAARKAAK